MISLDNTGPAYRQSITVSVIPAAMPDLQRLPWHKPLEKWTSRDVRFIPVKSGLSRHLVRFISIRGKQYAIKETAADIAGRELRSYERLQQLGIPTLKPVGMVSRDDGVIAVDTPAGSQFVENEAGYLVTSLLEYALPNYHLFKRAFTKENRRRIWDAIVKLFVQLHLNSVYWGDATLSNMMIVFHKERLPEIGVRTVLRAVLADAETVEFPPVMSEHLRLADVDYFLESMHWTEADMQASGIITESLMTSGDQEYIRQRYLDLYEIEHEEKRFELITDIDVDKLLGSFDQKGEARALLQHIYEHKWYLSEQRKKEVPVAEAARDWYATVFKPVLKLFSRAHILDEFPDSTPASLYLDIMLRKYYLSERMGNDVGLIAAFEDYAGASSHSDKTRRKLSGLVNSVRKLVTGKTR